MSDEDAIAREILSKLKMVDPEDISKDTDDKYSVKLNSMVVLRSGWQGSRCIFINDNKLESSQYRIDDIIDFIHVLYREESKRKRIQEISTDLGI